MELQDEIGDYFPFTRVLVVYRCMRLLIDGEEVFPIMVKSQNSENSRSRSEKLEIKKWKLLLRTRMKLVGILVVYPGPSNQKLANYSFGYEWQ